MVVEQSEPAVLRGRAVEGEEEREEAVEAEARLRARRRSVMMLHYADAGEGRARWGRSVTGGQRRVKSD